MNDGCDSHKLDHQYNIKQVKNRTLIKHAYMKPFNANANTDGNQIDMQIITRSYLHTISSIIQFFI